MKPEEVARNMGITTEELFERSYQAYGRIFNTTGASADLAWYRRWKTVPPYVIKYAALHQS